MYRDEWGIVYKEQSGYCEMVGHPLADITDARGLEAYPWPDPHDERRFDGLEEEVRELNEHSDYAIMFGGFSESFFGLPSWLIGHERFYTKHPVIENREDGEVFTDEWGVRWKKPEEGLYFDLDESPLSGEITEADVENHPWPDPQDPSLLTGLREKALAYLEAGYAVILESLCAGVFEMSCRIRGYEQFYSDLALNPSLACRLMDKIVDQKIRFYEMAAEHLGGMIQFVREGDDIAGQESLLMSPAFYREYLKPRHHRLLCAQKEIFPAPFYVFFHSDGAIYEIIPDFIEVGVEVLNPVQVTGSGIALTKVKEEFGGRMSFWGGGVDTQHVLPSATADVVKQDVRKRIEVLAPGGGYIFGSIHNIQADVPPESILAMWDAFREMRAYR